jgi:hypothetical protein
MLIFNHNTLGSGMPENDPEAEADNENLSFLFVEGCEATGSLDAKVAYMVCTLLTSPQSDILQSDVLAAKYSSSEYFDQGNMVLKLRERPGRNDQSCFKVV